VGTWTRLAGNKEKFGSSIIREEPEASVDTFLCDVNRTKGCYISIPEMPTASFEDRLRSLVGLSTEGTGTSVRMGVLSSLAVLLERERLLLSLISRPIFC